jgi:hypothetical protein
MTARSKQRRIGAAVVTLATLAVIVWRMPAGRIAAALRAADYWQFLALMVPNTIFYFCWDTLVLQRVVAWFHGDVPYRELLPVRAASYVVGFFNTNAGRGALAAYLWRRLDVSFLELGGTVIFLVLTEYLQLVVWAMLGVFGFRSEITSGLLPIAFGVALIWLGFFGYTRFRITPGRLWGWLFAPRDWQVFRTFRRAGVGCYWRVVILRAPMFGVSLAAHYYAAHAFGIRIPFGQLLTFLPVVFMVAALPVTVAHLGTTQAAWLFFFGQYAPAPQLLAFSLVAHLTFAATRALIGLVWLPVAYSDLVSLGDGSRPSLLADNVQSSRA